MSQIIHELATINVSEDAIRGLDLGGIYQSFSKNYKKLDDLKNFRAEHEQRNVVMRWWHSDKLQDAQLDSAEVQAEFSKTIGQLMMISILQSKKLTEQQQQLNGQQGALRKQADGIASQAAVLQQQHHALAKQSEELERLVKDYFALKGLTEHGAQRLIEIAGEIKSTKQSMLDEFATRSHQLESSCTALASEVSNLRGSVAEKIDDINQRTLEATQVLRGEMISQANITATAQAAIEQKVVQAGTACDRLASGLEQVSRDGREATAKQAESLARVSDDLKSLSEDSVENQRAAAQLKSDLERIVRDQQKANDQTVLAMQQAEHALRKMAVKFNVLSIFVAGLVVCGAFSLVARP